jgi:hypothetical protein
MRFKQDAILPASRRMAPDCAMREAHSKIAQTSLDTFVLHAVHIGRTTGRDAVDKPKQRIMNTNLVTQYQTSVADDGSSVDRRIRAFLTGETSGEDVLRALYGDVANEPVPERLRALLRS